MSHALAVLLDRGTQPLDRLRSVTFQLVLGAAPLRWLLARRERRFALIAVLHVLVALPLAILVPSLLLVVGPLVLGVPHLAADLRYLVLRRRLPAWWRRVVWVGCGGLFALRVVEQVGGSSHASSEMLGVSVWVITAAVAGAAASARWNRLAVALPVTLLLSSVLLHDPTFMRLVVAHGHNLVALVIWFLLFRGKKWAALIPLGVVAAGGVLLVSGAAAPWTLAHGQLQVLGMHVLNVADWMAPGLPLYAAIGLTCSYAFLQSVHYLVWLGYVPQDDSRGQGTPTFRMSGRSLLRDFGTLGVAGLVVLSLLVVGYGIFEPLDARSLYLSLASFHGYFELAMLAFFLTRGEALSSERVRATS